MKLGKFTFGFFCVLSIVFFSCGSSPQARLLDKNEISGPVKVYSASLLTKADLFGDQLNKELLQTYYQNNREQIKQSVFDNYQIRLDDEEFINAITTLDNIRVEDIGTNGLRAKRYYWNSASKDVVYAEFIITGVVLNDGSMPLEVQIRKDDPEYEPGYAMSINLAIKASK